MTPAPDEIAGPGNVTAPPGTKIGPTTAAAAGDDSAIALSAPAICGLVRPDPAGVVLDDDDDPDEDDDPDDDDDPAEPDDPDDNPEPDDEPRAPDPDVLPPA